MEERFVKNWPVSLLLVLRTQKYGGSSSVRWLLGLILAKKKLHYFSEPCQVAPVTIQKFLEMRCCLTKCSEKK